MRPKLSVDLEAQVLIKSGRRCSFCFGLHADFELKHGQIAHLDRNPQNNDIENLAFLCLSHHDQYDSQTSQSKGFKPSELREYRRRLHEKVERTLGAEQKFQESLEQSLLEESAICGAVDHLWRNHEDPRVSDQIADRFRRLLEAIKEFEESTSELFCASDMTEEETAEDERILLRERTRCLIKYQLPEGVYFVDDGVEDISEEWIKSMEVTFDLWRCGQLSYRECGEMLEDLDWSYDLDIFFVLFGVPHSILGPLGMRYLRSEIYHFGMRNRDELS